MDSRSAFLWITGMKFCKTIPVKIIGNDNKILTVDIEIEKLTKEEIEAINAIFD